MSIVYLFFKSYTVKQRNMNSRKFLQRVVYIAIESLRLR